MWARAIVPSSALGAFVPSNGINIAVIGTGNQSQVDLPAFLQQPDAQDVAACDVNTASHEYKTPQQFLGRKPGHDRVNGYCAKKMRLKRKICWDPKLEQIIGDDEASKMLSRPLRAPWTM